MWQKEAKYELKRAMLCFVSATAQLSQPLGQAGERVRVSRRNPEANHLSAYHLAVALLLQGMVYTTIAT